MTSRIRILITALLVCHLLVAPRLVTSQFRPSPPPSTSQANAPAAAAPDTAEQEVTIEAREQEKAGDVFNLRGDVVITYNRLTLRADEVTYNAATGEASASGHLRLDGGIQDEHLEASHGSYNVRLQSGKFYDVVGTIGARMRGRQVLLTSSNPFFFRGQVVEQTGPGRYVVNHGEVTTCELPHPKWVFDAGKATVEVGEEARLYHSTFRLWRVPLFYFPYVQHPVEKLGRQSGFLIPTIGQSSVKGTILGDSFYWAINRSMDATVGAEYFSKRGWSQDLDLRARPSESSYLDMRYFGVLDRGLNGVDQGGEDVHLSGEAHFKYGIRGVADIDYLSSYLFRLAFAESFSQAVNSEVRSNAFASKSADGFSFNVLGSRYQNYESTQHGDLITILHAPSLDLGATEHSLGKLPAYWSYDVALQGVSRREPNFVTDPLVGRFDLEPRLAVPLLMHGWSVRPEIALRETDYTQGRIPTSGIGTPSSQPVDRRALESSVELRAPSLSRVFQRKLLNHTFKHVIEPKVTWRYVTGIDNFSDIIRFDSRDILSNTDEIEYSVVQRIFAKPVSSAIDCAAQEQESPDSGLVSEGEPAPAPQNPATPTHPSGGQPCVPGAAAARNILTWEVAQKTFFDPTFGGALVPGQRNMLTTTADLTGIAFLTEARTFSPVISRMRLDASRTTDGEWEIDYDSKKGRISASTAVINHHFGQFFIGGSQAFFQVVGEVPAVTTLPTQPPTDFNQFRWLAGYGNPNKRGISAAANIGFDVNSGFLQYSAFQTSYNWDCCGLSFEYRRFALGAVRNENQFRFALSLTNVGTFGNLRRQERLF